MPDTDPDELVYIKHPKIEGLGGPVTRRALDDIHAARGWSAATDSDVEKAATAAAAVPTDAGKGK